MNANDKRERSAVNEKVVIIVGQKVMLESKTSTSWLVFRLVGAVAATAVLLRLMPRVENPAKGHNIGFVGNSIIFFNDLPRVLEEMTGNSIYQNSCLHGSLNLLSILQRGNGMYNKWRTHNAKIRHVNHPEYKNATLYDYGLCSFPQLLFGYDANLFSGAYIDDGVNPCFQDPDYLAYLNETYTAPRWDFVVINDQTTYPGVYYKRNSCLLVLKSVYANMLLESGGRPVFLVTHGYNKTDFEGNNNTGSPLGSIPEFTSRIHHGYEIYARTLSDYLPSDQQPLLAPVGLVYLLIWEKNVVFWEKLFFYDGFHPSPHGTYLIALTLYATMFGKMPSTDFSLHDNLEELWYKARRMQGYDLDYPNLPFPTFEEANYIYQTVRRVVLQGQLPSTLLDEDTVEAMEVDEGYQGWYNTDGDI